MARDDRYLAPRSAAVLDEDEERAALAIDEAISTDADEPQWLVRDVENPDSLHTDFFAAREEAFRRVEPYNPVAMYERKFVVQLPIGEPAILPT